MGLMMVLAVVFGGFWYLSTFTTMPSDVPVGDRVVGGVVTGTAFGVLFGLWLERQRRRGGADGRQRAVRRAIRRGAVPDDADADQWRRAITHYEQSYRQQRRFGPVVFAVALLLEVSVAVTGRPLFWFAAAFFLVMLVVSLVQTRKVLRNAASMLTELDRRDSATNRDGTVPVRFHKVCEWRRDDRGPRDVIVERGVWVAFDARRVAVYEFDGKDTHAAVLLPEEVVAHEWRERIDEEPAAWLLPHLDRLALGHEVRVDVLREYAVRQGGTPPTIEWAIRL